MSKIVSNALVLGQSLTDTFNFLLDTDVAGALRLRRKSDGSGGNVLAVDVSGNLTANDTALQKMQLWTVHNTTSGTAIDFMSIPSWVKRITVMLNEVSTNGTSPVQVQIGAGSFTISGYFSTAGNIQTSSISSGSSTTGFIECNDSAAEYVRSGVMTISTLGNNVWVYQSTISADHDGRSRVHWGAGSVTLAGVLDCLRLTTVNGTDTFDAGSVNLLLEGY